MMNQRIILDFNSSKIDSNNFPNFMRKFGKLFSFGLARFKNIIDIISNRTALFITADLNNNFPVFNAQLLKISVNHALNFSLVAAHGFLYVIAEK